MRNFLAGASLILGTLLFVIFGVDLVTHQIAEPLFSIIFLLAQLFIGLFGALQGRVRLAVSITVFLFIELVIWLFIPSLWFVSYF